MASRNYFVPHFSFEITANAFHRIESPTTCGTLNARYRRYDCADLLEPLKSPATTQFLSLFGTILEFRFLDTSIDSRIWHREHIPLMRGNTERTNVNHRCWLIKLVGLLQWKGPVLMAFAYLFDHSRASCRPRIYDIQHTACLNTSTLLASSRK